MSFIIKGGYDAVCKGIINVSLQRTKYWKHGAIYGDYGRYMGRVSPTTNNKLEMIKNNGKYTLLLNNMAIYEDKQLFSYKLELASCPDTYKHEEVDLKSFIDYYCINYEEIKNIDVQRYVN